VAAFAGPAAVAYANLLQNNNHKTKHKNNTIAGAPSSQALSGFLITAPPSECVPDVSGALPVWIQNQKKKKNVTHIRNSNSILDFCISLLMLSMWINVINYVNFCHVFIEFSCIHTCVFKLFEFYP